MEICSFLYQLLYWYGAVGSLLCMLNWDQIEYSAMLYCSLHLVCALLLIWIVFIGLLSYISGTTSNC